MIGYTLMKGKIVLPLFWKGSILKGKTLLPGKLHSLWEQFVFFQNKSLFRRGLVYRKQTGSHKSCLPYISHKFPTLVMLNKLRCLAHFLFSANQIAWSKLLIQIQILNSKQCRSRSVGFFRSQLIWIYTVCKGRVYPGSAGQGLILSIFINIPWNNNSKKYIKQN